MVIVILMCSLGRSLAQDIAVGTMSKKVYTTCKNQKSPSDKFLRRFDIVVLNISAFQLLISIAVRLTIITPQFFNLISSNI